MYGRDPVTHTRVNPLHTQLGEDAVGAPVHQTPAYADTVTSMPSDGSQTKPETQTTGHYIPPQDLIMEIMTNRQLRVSKAFYFFFFAAFGSLFPLMAVYFKQLGMNSVQAGILIGIRPFIEIFSAPLWGSLADRFRKGKLMIIGSIACWIIFTCAQAYIRPPIAACVVFNASHYVMYPPYTKETDEWYEVAVVEKDSADIVVHTTPPPGTVSPLLVDLSLPLIAMPNSLMSDTPLATQDQPMIRRKREAAKKKKTSIFDSIDPVYRNKPPPDHIIGKSPVSIDYALNYNKDKHASYVSPAFSNIVYKWEGVEEVFFLLLLLVLLGEFFSAPAVTLADTATLSYLGEHTDLYVRQRMFGSVGWGISMYFVGIALDRSTDFPDHPCGPHQRERNYKTCFTYFAVLMLIALLISTQFLFEYENVPYQNQDDIHLNPFDPSKNIAPRPIFNTAPPINPPPDLLMQGKEKKFEFIDKWKSAVFAQRTRELPEWITVMKALGSSVRYGSFLLVVWFMGLGMGLVFSFLFWHLQDLGGTPTLFGVASVINHVSEILAYLYSVELIKELGHTRVLCIGLAANVCRFLLIAWVDNPWWVLPFELVQGVTHATVWAASCSYMTQATEPHLRSSAQAVLHALHHGLGRGTGAIVGGYFINVFGTRVTFACYGLLSALLMMTYIRLNYVRSKDGSGAQGWREDQENRQVVMDSSAGLAPHGVPSIPVAKSASRINVRDAPFAMGDTAVPQASNFPDPTFQANAEWEGFNANRQWQ